MQVNNTLKIEKQSSKLGERKTFLPAALAFFYYYERIKVGIHHLPSVVVQSFQLPQVSATS